MKKKQIAGLVLRAVALGSGVSVMVLALMARINVGQAILLLALGLTCLSLSSLERFSVEK